MRIALFGEDSNDLRALKELILAIRPDIHRGQIHVLRDPPSLNRGAGTPAVRTFCESVAKSVAALESVGEAVSYVLTHTDSDQFDRGAFEASRTKELRDLGLQNASAVVPVEAIESWWLSFPKQTESIVAGWRGALPDRAYETDMVTKPKADLIRRTRAKSSRRPYQESDSEAIAVAIGLVVLKQRPKPTSASFTRFKKLIASL